MADKKAAFWIPCTSEREDRTFGHQEEEGEGKEESFVLEGSGVWTLYDTEFVSRLGRGIDRALALG